MCLNPWRFFYPLILSFYVVHILITVTARFSIIWLMVCLIIHNSHWSWRFQFPVWFLEARSLKMICFSAEVADDINSFALGGSLGPCVKLISSCSSVFFCFLFWNLPISPFGFCAFGGDCLREPESLFPSWLNISLHPPLTGLVRLQLPCLYTSLDLSRLSFLTEWIVSVMLTVSVFDIKCLTKTRYKPQAQCLTIKRVHVPNQQR